MNLLLWGCETWSMRKALSNKLEVFLYRNIRQILRISMFRVKEEHLNDEHVRRMFYDIPRVGNMIAARQLDFLGKTMRSPYDPPAQQMMTACCNNVRRVGLPFLPNKDFIVKNLRLFLQTSLNSPLTNMAPSRTGSTKPATNNIGVTSLHASPTNKPPFPRAPPNFHAQDEARGIMMPPPKSTTLPPNTPVHPTHKSAQITLTRLR